MSDCNTILYNPTLGVCCGGMDNSFIGVGSIKIFIPCEFLKTKSFKEILSKPNYYFFEASSASMEAESNVEYFCAKVWRIYKSYNTIGYYETEKEAKQTLDDIFTAIDKNKNYVLS